MNADYEKCRYAKGCEKMVLNKSGLCTEHRRQKCDFYQCKTMITARQGAKYCEKHQKVRARDEVQTWDMGASV